MTRAAGDQWNEIEFTLGGRDAAIRMRFDPDKQTQSYLKRILSAGKLYDPAVVQLMATVLKPGDAFIDVGAHIGFFTLIGARLVGPEGHVVAIEPDPANMAALLDHVSMNDAVRVRTISGAACDRDGPVRFWTNLDNDGGHAIFDPGGHPDNPKSAERPTSGEVPGVTLETALGQCGLTGAKLAKIDVEGAEPLVLAGGRRLLEGWRIPFLICEVNPYGLKQVGSSTEELFATMRGYGYDTFVLQRDGSLPRLVPANMGFRTEYVFNVLFSPCTFLAGYWQAEPQ